MSIVDTNWNPTHRQLWQFGTICLFALPLSGWIWGAGVQLMIMLAVIGLVLAVCGIIIPAVVKPVFIGCMVVVTPIGMLAGELAMLLIYFGVFVPIGLVFRIMRRDALQLKIDTKAETYWQTKRQPKHAESYFRQF